MTYIGSLEYDEQIKHAAGVIIFGGGFMLQHLLNKMKELHLEDKVIAVCDNNTAMHGEKVFGIPVWAPDEAFQKYRDTDFIVYNNYFLEICNQLLENNIKKIHLIRWGSL